MKLKPFSALVAEDLRDPVFAAAYLDASSREGDPAFMLRALRKVVEVQGGVGELARRTRLSRTSLYKTLSPRGNPEVATLDAILGVYDLRLSFSPVVRERRGRYRAKRRR